MTDSRHQTHYQAYRIHEKEKELNFFLGVAFEIEKPISNIVESFFRVLTSPVERN